MSEDIVVRNANLEDLVQMDAIEELCFGERSRFPYETLLELLSARNVVGLSALFEEVVVGFIFFTTHPAIRTSTVITLDIHPEFRRRGIARDLMERMMAIAQGQGKNNVVLQVDVENTQAQELYHSLGFEQKGKLRDYYGEGLDAYELSMELPSK